MTAESQWLPPESAPKDGTMFLGDFGWPWALAAVWHPADGKWAYAMPQCCGEGESADWYFENDSEKETALRRWVPMPEL